jgi:hypothetical protein
MGLKLAAIEYERSFRRAHLRTDESCIAELIDNFNLFVLGYLHKPLRTYLALVSRDAREYAGYAIEAAQS